MDFMKAVCIFLSFVRSFFLVLVLFSEHTIFRSFWIFVLFCFAFLLIINILYCFFLDFVVYIHFLLLLFRESYSKIVLVVVVASCYVFEGDNDGDENVAQKNIYICVYLSHIIILILIILITFHVVAIDKWFNSLFKISRL